MALDLKEKSFDSEEYGVDDFGVSRDCEALVVAVDDDAQFLQRSVESAYI